MTSAAALRSLPSPAPEPSACYLCGGNRLSLRHAARGEEQTLEASAYNCTSFGHRTHPPIWGCNSCGLQFQWPLRSPEALLAAYRDVEDPLYVAERENRYLTFRRVLQHVGIETPGQRLLDVGAYCGYFVDVAREAGYHAEGLELSRWAADQARSLGLTIHGETLAQRAAHGAPYDVVTLWDVVEHFADPREELRHAFRLVRPGGRIFLSTIDAGSLVARMLGSRWPWLMDMHLFYFDRATLGALLEEVGFRVTRTVDYTHIVSSGYLLRKTGASFPWLAPLTRLVGKVAPGRLPIPINLGDNMLIEARRP